MNLLAFDTACDACSVALWRDGALIGYRARPMARGQSEALVPMIEATMAEAGVSFADLSGIAVTVGPGAFTGLRIGLATARAMALAAGRPAVGVTTFDALAAAALRLTGDARRNLVGDAPRNLVGDTPRNLVVAIDTKRGDLYVQAYRWSGPQIGFVPSGEPAALAAAQARALLPAGPLLLAGDGAAQLRAALDQDGSYTVLSDAMLPDAQDVAAIAARRLASGEPLAPLRPLYLRPPAVRLPASPAVAAGPGVA